MNPGNISSFFLKNCGIKRSFNSKTVCLSLALAGFLTFSVDMCEAFPKGDILLTNTQTSSQMVSFAQENQSFVGTWYRYIGERAYQAQIRIFRSDKDNSLKFRMTANKGANSGVIEGTLNVVSPSLATYLVPGSDKDKSALLKFIFSPMNPNDKSGVKSEKQIKRTTTMQVELEGDLSLLGLGNGVEPTGYYTTTEIKTYQSDSYPDLVFGHGQVKDKFRRLAGNYVLDKVVDVMKNGCSTQMDTYKYEGYIPGTGQHVFLEANPQANLYYLCVAGILDKNLIGDGKNVIANSDFDQNKNNQALINAKLRDKCTIQVFYTNDPNHRKIATDEIIKVFEVDPSEVVMIYKEL